MTSLDALQARVNARVAAAKISSTKLQLKMAPPPPSLEAQWRPAAIVLQSQAWQCTCGAHGVVPLGLFLLREHIRLANSHWLIALKGEPPGYSDLPRRLAVFPSAPVELCPECAQERGFYRTRM